MLAFVRRCILNSDDAYCVQLGNGLVKAIESTPLGRAGDTLSATAGAMSGTSASAQVSAKSAFEKLFAPGRRVKLIEIDERVVAEQLTLHLFNTMYLEIEHTEFFNAGWTSKGAHITSKNVLRMIDYFNYVSSMVSCMILLEQKLKERVKLLEHFIKIAYELRKLNNFHLLVAVLGGLGGKTLFFGFQWFANEN